MNKKARDNRANQMNPNNPAYYKSRQGNKQKTKTKVVHHHHHHNHGSKNQGFACPCCGKRGKLSAWSFVGGDMYCGHCGSTFWR